MAAVVFVSISNLASIFSVRNDLNIADLQNVCIEVRKPQSKLLIVVNWYRPPNSPVRLYSHLENLIGKLDLTNFDFFLLEMFRRNEGVALEGGNQVNLPDNH
ncbi:unnamed protein product [Porites lobata]|uniref:Uncharacterized protein n=1 Tax=Porites lobata TaxID=104759 RepID=A0ABN8N9C2_9CNID|nr:unnamed protein product [Porites lobata]